jgi:adenylate kinase family enzyme
VKRPKEDFIKDQQALVDKEKWIIEGNCLNSLAARLARADQVIYLRVGRARALYRIFKRMITQLWRPHRSDIPMGCRDYVTWRLIKYTWH